MKKTLEEKYYPKTEDRWNSFSHALGIILGIFAAFLLLSKAQGNPSNLAVPSIICYLFGMEFSYLSSTLYHMAPAGKVKKRLRNFDHAAIYLHIAGSYCPFLLLILWDVNYWGVGLLLFIGISAILGFVISFRKMEKHSYLETVAYIVMGASVLIALHPLYIALDNHNSLYAFWWLIIGGISYIIGALFYSLHKRSYMHLVFHLFVLGGSMAHIYAIYCIL